MPALYVQFGSGSCAPSEWWNFDTSPTLRFERIPVIGKLYTRNSARFPPNVYAGDIVKGLPIQERSCAGIYSSHVLEHLALEDCRTALRNVFSYLAPGGVFRLVVPDLERLANRYVSNPSRTAAAEFLLESGLGRKQRPRGVAGLVQTWLGNSEHLWMWDEKAMIAELETAGFLRIRRCSFGDARDHMFNLVEERARFDGCLAIEALR
jgi:hypothetical protein